MGLNRISRRLLRGVYAAGALRRRWWGGNGWSGCFVWKWGWGVQVVVDRKWRMDYDKVVLFEAVVISVAVLSGTRVW